MRIPAPSPFGLFFAGFFANQAIGGGDRPTFAAIGEAYSSSCRGLYASTSFCCTCIGTGS